MASSTLSASAGATPLSDKTHRNLLFLQKLDPSICAILDSTTHTAVYRFDPASEKWVRFGVEGSAFVVALQNSQHHQFIILNKQGIDNLVLDLASVNKIKLQPPYVMIRYSTGGAPVILGFWFHEDSERERLLATISRSVGLVCVVDFWFMCLCVSAD
jgi:hypothetical protein